MDSTLKHELIRMLKSKEDPMMRIHHALALLEDGSLGTHPEDSEKISPAAHSPEPTLKPWKATAQAKDSNRTYGNTLIGEAPSMKLVRDAIARVSQSHATVMIRGESGTGKELVARAIHHHSPRKSRPFIAVHCAAVPESLIESTLFGHERGAFTGAVQQRKGRLEQAHGGTLFLDEVGDIPPATQIKLLRVLQEKEFERVGGDENLHVDVRIISATHRDLEAMILNGAFREDLYYRLNVIPLTIPPLRDRKEDIPPLLRHFLCRFNEENHREIDLDTEIINLMVAYHWPGNIRELQNCVERLVVLAGTKKITMTSIPEPLKPYFDHLRSVASPSIRKTDRPKPESLPARLDELECGRLKEALDRTGWVKAKAGRLLGLTPRQVAYKVQKYHLLQK